MAVQVMTKPHVTFNNVDISEWIESAEWGQDFDEAMTFASGDTARQRHAGGAEDGELRLSIIMDYAANASYATITPQVGKIIDVKVRPSTDVIAADNPEKRGKIHVREWSFVVGRVGEVARQDVAWPNADQPTIHTS